MSGQVLFFDAPLAAAALPVDSRAGSRPRPQAADPTVAAPGPRDAELFRRTMLPHLDAAYGFARFLTRDSATAEDLTQDAYLRAWQSFAGYRGGDAKAWLLAIVRTSFYSTLRAQRTWSQSLERASSANHDAPPDSAEEELMRSAEVHDVRQAVEALPDPFRETLVLRELQEMSYREVAQITGAPLGTVMSRLARARRMLTAALVGGAA